MLTCRACGVEPYVWLRHVLTELPCRPPDADITDLMPFNFPERAPAPKHQLMFDSSPRGRHDPVAVVRHTVQRKSRLRSFHGYSCSLLASQDCGSGILCFSPATAVALIGWQL
jgi:hypothetical protein